MELTDISVHTDRSYHFQTFLSEAFVFFSMPPFHQAAFIFRVTLLRLDLQIPLLFEYSAGASPPHLVY
jgi:hypothetical protein